MKDNNTVQRDGKTLEHGFKKRLKLPIFLTSSWWVLEPPQRRGPAARGFVEMPRIPPRQEQGSNK